MQDFFINRAFLLYGICTLLQDLTRILSLSLRKVTSLLSITSHGTNWTNSLKRSIDMMQFVYICFVEVCLSQVRTDGSVWR